MAGKRSFSADDTPKKAEDYHGMAKYASTSPDVAAKGVESVNVHFTFEEALRLSLAIQACLLNLNKYDRSNPGRNQPALQPDPGARAPDPGEGRKTLAHFP